MRNAPPRRRKVGDLYRRYFREPRRERLFIASIAFFLTFGIARLITHAIRGGADLFGDFSVRGQHVHHLVWGILLLLVVGYAWMIQVGNGHSGPSPRTGRVLAAIYGIGAALTLDEFALWLNLRDVYWERQGRASIDVVALFGALVSAGVWGGPFVRAVVREAVRLSRIRWRRSARRS